MHERRIIIALLLAASPVAIWACGEDLPMGGVDDAAFHLRGWVSDGTHSGAFYDDRARCERCHGEQLDGGPSAVSCEQCHPGWKTDCTFCHGGTEGDSGAPPAGVNGELERGDPAVGAHTAHLTEGPAHLAYACATCHAVPASIDDPGHLDASPHAEVAFATPNDESAWYDAPRSNCAALYCHSDGRGNPVTIKWTATDALGCDGCHGDAADPAGMSGRHGSHLGEGIACSACHAEAVDADGALLDKRRHVDGHKDVSLQRGTWDPAGRSCDTRCHGGDGPYTW